MLPVASLLLALLAEHRADVEKLDGLGELVEVVLDVGAHRPGRTLGSQCHLPFALVREGEHLLLDDDVRALPRRPGEESRFLEYWRADLGVVVTDEKLACPILDEG